jgi:hypothetical protein
MSHIYENPVETEVDLVAGILSLSQTSQATLRGYAMNVARRCKACNEVCCGQFDSSCELFENKTTKIYNSRENQEV